MGKMSDKILTAVDPRNKTYDVRPKEGERVCWGSIHGSRGASYVFENVITMTLHDEFYQQKSGKVKQERTRPTQHHLKGRQTESNK
jgi:hypothetical protein